MDSPKRQLSVGNGLYFPVRVCHSVQLRWIIFSGWGQAAIPTKKLGQANIPKKIAKHGGVVEVQRNLTEFCYRHSAQQFKIEIVPYRMGTSHHPYEKNWDKQASLRKKLGQANIPTKNSEAWRSGGSPATLDRVLQPPFRPDEVDNLFRMGTSRHPYEKKLGQAKHPYDF